MTQFENCYISRLLTSNVLKAALGPEHFFCRLKIVCNQYCTVNFNDDTKASGNFFYLYYLSVQQLKRDGTLLFVCIKYSFDKTIQSTKIWIKLGGYLSNAISKIRMSALCFLFGPKHPTYLPLCMSGNTDVRLWFCLRKKHIKGKNCCRTPLKRKVLQVKKSARLQSSHQYFTNFCT